MTAVQTIRDSGYSSAVASKMQRPQGVLGEGLTATSNAILLPEVNLESHALSALQRMLWQRRDKIRSTWPSYKEVRERLIEQLAQEMDLDSSSLELLVREARRFRNAFWMKDDLLSGTSYRAIYKSRVLLEIAHLRSPRDKDIVGELVETIQAAHPVWRIREGSNARTPSEELWKWDDQLAETLAELRSREFEQIKREVGDNGRPTKEDFRCAIDLAVLLQHQDPAAALPVIEWLEGNAARGAWTEHMGHLKSWKGYLKEGDTFEYTIYIGVDVDPMLEAKYARRLPSFRGPNSDERTFFLYGLEDNLAGRVHWAGP